jgi:hypothetical protein
MDRFRNEFRRHLTRCRRRTSIALGIGAILFLLCACESSHLLVGDPRAPIPVRDVTLYVTPPAAPYEKIAILETSSKHSLAFTEGGKTEVVLGRLRAEAARLGANGVLLQAVADQADGSFDTGVGTSLTGVHGTVGVGWGTSSGKTVKIGRAVAVYVDPASTPR